MPLKHEGLDFSFSGLKTAVIHAHNKGAETAEIAFGLQHTIAQVLAHKCEKALSETGLTRLVVAGGVAKNQTIRHALENMCTQNQIQFYAPPLKYCTDNAVMIAVTAAERVKAYGVADVAQPQSLQPRWPLDNLRVSA